MSVARFSTLPFTFGREAVESHPYPHVAKEPFIDELLYDRLLSEFPADAVFDKCSAVGGRAGRDIYVGDPEFDDLMRNSPAWREFAGHLRSPAFVNFILELFKEYLPLFHCRVNALRARYVDYVEPREVLAEKSRFMSAARQGLERLVGGNCNDLFVRVDLAQAGVGYGKAVHCDRPNRLISMLIYFCDADEIALDGGELLLHKHLMKKDVRAYERHPKPGSTEVVRRLRARKNLGLVFLGCNNSYHEATAVRSLRGYRRFVYISVSSRALSIW